MFIKISFNYGLILVVVIVIVIVESFLYSGVLKKNYKYKNKSNKYKTKMPMLVSKYDYN